MTYTIKQCTSTTIFSYFLVAQFTLYCNMRLNGLTFNNNNNNNNKFNVHFNHHWHIFMLSYIHSCVRTGNNISLA